MSEKEFARLVKTLVKTYLEVRKVMEDFEEEIIRSLVEPIKELERKYTVRRFINELLEDIEKK